MFANCFGKLSDNIFLPSRVERRQSLIGRCALKPIYPSVINSLSANNFESTLSVERVCTEFIKIALLWPLHRIWIQTERYRMQPDVVFPLERTINRILGL